MTKQKLIKIYRLYDLWAKEFDFACTKGCSTCCTQSVSMTSLEAEMICEYIAAEKPELQNKLRALPQSNVTQATTNQFAASCLQGEEVEGQVDPWNKTPCVFLQDNCCTIYPVRSFMCRSFGSRTACKTNGEAEIEPLFLTLNTIILQCIEHLDQGRPWGNMNTILRLYAENSRGGPDARKENFRIAQPLPGFLIPPDEENAIHNQLQTLLKIISMA